MYGAVALRPTASDATAHGDALRRHAPRVLVADDHAPMRLGVCHVLHEHGFDVCAEAADAPSAVAAALRERPDICVLDIRMPGDGVAAAEEIAAKLPETAVVMLTVSHDEAEFERSLRAGAAAFLLKDADPETLPAALYGVLRGEAILPRPLVSKLVDEMRARHSRAAALRELGVTFTSREGEVVDLLCQGLPTGEIAKRLFVSNVTVRTHICTILKKLRVADRKGAVDLLTSGRETRDARSSPSSHSTDLRLT
jgi:two-component system nitrate/nitrite response regulator NarL